jgi:hypothetical protein
VKVTGGQGAIITAPFMIFQNPKSKYPIHEEPDNIPNVSYCSAISGFITFEVLHFDWMRALQIILICMDAKNVFMWTIV